MLRFLWIPLLVFGSLAHGQQGFKLGLHGGLPLGREANDAVSLVAGVDAGYHLALGEVVDAGVMTGYILGFPEKFDAGGANLPHVQFLPLAISVRFWMTNSFCLGGDAGRAFGLNSGNEGGFYYRPMVGYLMGPQTAVTLSYTGIDSENLPWETLNLGVVYTFPRDIRR